MKFIESFTNQIRAYNGRTVHLIIIQIDATNHPLGPMGAMMMGPQQTDRVNQALRSYDGKNGIIEMNADMELISNSVGEKLVFLNNDFECNCIEVFRPNPPMIIGEADMSLWWSYHPLREDMVNSQLSLLNNKAKILNTSAKGDSFPIRDIIVNDISHCLQTS